MLLITRRRMLVAGGTLAVGLHPRKPGAVELHDLARDLVLTDPPVPAPEITFVAPDGSEHHLADFAGHGMVINLWATWCVPCVEEMPSLAALSKTLAPDDIAVLPLSSDRGGARVVEAFYQAARHHRTAGAAGSQRARRRTRGTCAASPRAWSSTSWGASVRGWKAPRTGPHRRRRRSCGSWWLVTATQAACPSAALQFAHSVASVRICGSTVGWPRAG